MKKVLNKNKGIIIFISILAIISIICLSIFRINKNNKLGELTTEEKLEDFRYMYDTLKDNYPYFDAYERVYGDNWLEHKEEFEEIIINTNSNIDFFNCLYDIVAQLKDCHCSVITPDFYFLFLDNYKSNTEAIKENPKFYELFSDDIDCDNVWYNIFCSSQKKYKDWFSLYKKEYPDLLYADTKEKYYYNAYNSTKTFETKIIIENKIAYLKIYSMFQDLGTIEKEDEILEFLKKIKDYPYLIIDIMGNSGGSDYYWIKNIVQPLIKEPLKFNYYSVIRGDNYSLPALKIKYDNIENIDKLLSAGKYPKEVKDKFKYYIKSPQEIPPENSVGFNGKIYLLVDDNVFSAADHLADFSKNTNFATLVGFTTKGGGRGSSPIFLKLPNSELIVEFEVEMALNSDGTTYYETKTIPDIKFDRNKFSNKDILYKTIDIILNNKNNQ